MKKKILLILGVFIFLFSSVNAYTASEHLEIHFNTTSVWTTEYVVPEGKDLLIYRLYALNNNTNLKIRDGGAPVLADGDFTDNIYDIFFTIEDELQVSGVPDANDFILFGYLVNEGEDIEDYMNGVSSGINKNIFTKEDLEYFYFWQFVVLAVISIYVFIERVILGRKLDIRLF